MNGVLREEGEGFNSKCFPGELCEDIGGVPWDVAHGFFEVYLDL